MTPVSKHEAVRESRCRGEKVEVEVEVEGTRAARVQRLL